MSTKSQVLRRIAKAMDAGMPTPISLTIYTWPISILAHQRAEWLAMIRCLGGEPSEGVLLDPYPGEHRPHWEWTDGEVEVTYLEDEVTKVEDES